MTVTKLAKGTANFTSYGFPLDYVSKDKGASGNEAINVCLDWQGYNELCEDHGLSLTYEVLYDNGLSLTNDRNITKLSSEISDLLGEDAWKRVEGYLLTLGKEKQQAAIYLQAVWAQCFAEPFEELWLASMAQHAYYVLEDDYAFGYLTAILDQKRNNEALFLRVEKNLVDSKLGGQSKPRADNLKTTEALSEMARLIGDGHTIARSASIAFKNGFGSSAGANRKLWTRHLKK